MGKRETMSEFTRLYRCEQCDRRYMAGFLFGRRVCPALIQYVGDYWRVCGGRLVSVIESRDGT